MNDEEIARQRRSRREQSGCAILATLLGLGFLAGLMIWLLGWGWSGRAPAWTGFGPGGLATEALPAKTLWDWLQLLIVPIVLAGGALWFNYTQKNTEIDLAEEARALERQIATDRQQQAALESYYDRMTDLLLNHNLRASAPGDEARSIARAITLAVLRGLDGERKTQAFRFLEEAELIEQPEPVVGLAGADLSDADLSHAVLSGGSFQRINLSRANLMFAKLSHADLFDANLSGARLGKADLSNSNLTRARLSAAEMPDVDLSMARMELSDLAWAKLHRANLSHADLSLANFWGAEVTLANLTSANLDVTNFTEANLSKSNLSGAKLNGTNLSKAQLQRAILHGAEFIGVPLYGTDVTKAEYTRSTIWPKGFNPIAAGAVLVEEPAVMGGE